MFRSHLHRIHRFRQLASYLVHKGETRILAPSEWQRMPTELVEVVFDVFLDHFSDSATPYLYRRSILQPALRAMACVSRHWYIMATEVLYEHIFVASHAALGMLATAMTDCNNKHLSDLVRSLEMNADIFESLRKADKHDYNERIRYYQMICDVCPNLSFVHQSSPRVGNILDTSCLDISELTHLDVSLEGDLARVDGDGDDNPSFFEFIKELPAVQELTIRACEDQSRGHGKRRHGPGIVVLPAMPRLRRLSIIGWDARFITDFSDLPPVRVLEYTNCIIDDLSDLLVVETVERLVITSPVTGQPGSPNRSPRKFFKDCNALTHLCIPFSVFWFCEMPRNLQYLLLDGIIDEDELKDHEDGLVHFFNTKVDASTMDPRTSDHFAKPYLMACLKHVHIVSSNILHKSKTTSRHEWHNAAKAAKKANVTLTVDTEG